MKAYHPEELTPPKRDREILSKMKDNRTVIAYRTEKCTTTGKAEVIAIVPDARYDYCAFTIVWLQGSNGGYYRPNAPTYNAQELAEMLRFGDWQIADNPALYLEEPAIQRTTSLLEGENSRLVQIGNKYALTRYNRGSSSTQTYTNRQQAIEDLLKHERL